MKEVPHNRPFNNPIQIEAKTMAISSTFTSGLIMPPSLNFTKYFRNVEIMSTSNWTNSSLISDISGDAQSRRVIIKKNLRSSSRVSVMLA